MTKITWKPGTLLSPVPPAMISCGTVKKPNVMTAAWTGIIASEPPMTYVSIRPERHSHQIISESKEFVINVTNLALVGAADYCGVKSGREHDKFKEMNLTALPCTQVSAPQIEESPISLECKVKDIQHFGTHDMFLAEIVAVNVDDKYVDEDNRLALEKAGIVAYMHGNYYTLGRNLGSFGFSVNKAKLKLAQKMSKVEVEVKPSKKSVIEKAASKFGKSRPNKAYKIGENRFGNDEKKPYRKASAPRSDDKFKRHDFNRDEENSFRHDDRKPRSNSQGKFGERKRFQNDHREDRFTDRKPRGSRSGSDKFKRRDNGFATESSHFSGDKTPHKKYGNNKQFLRNKRRED